MATKKSYDLALFRLTKILTMLSNNELPSMQELVDEFGVSLRTIQSDIYTRLNSFPIEKDALGQLKFVDGFSLNKSMLEDHEMVLLSLALSNFKDSIHFEKTSESILQKLIYPNLFNPYYIKQAPYEKLDRSSQIVKQLEVAIEGSNIIGMQVKDTYLEVEPYKIASYDGFWYLFAKDTHSKKIKTYMLSNIMKVTLHDTFYTTKLSKIQQTLDATHSAWFDDGEAFEVVVEVYPEISEYFVKRCFLQSQEIIETKEDGTLILKFEITHYEDIDNLVKSWLPHIKVLSPSHFHHKIKQELQAYINIY